MAAGRAYTHFPLLTLVALVAAGSAELHAQSSGSILQPSRSTGGWQRVQSAAPELESPVQRAFFQSQVGGGLPNLPPNFGGGGAASENRAFQSTGGLPDYPSVTAASGGNSAGPTQLPQSYSASGGSAGGPAPVLPPTHSSPGSSRPASRLNAQPAAATNQLRSQTTSAAQPSANQRANDLRHIQSDQPTSGSNPRLAAQSFATGLPYVTPAPRGRYPTSPYRGPMYQTASYQRTVPARLASTAAQTTAPVTAPAQNVLPQYQQPGIYPTAYQCTTPAPSFPSTGAVPGAYVPPTLTPNLTPGLYSPNNSGYSPLFSLGQENYNVLLGRGIIGQPTVYVPGQPIRNFMRYLSP